VNHFKGCYLDPEFLKFIDKEKVTNIVELGARDCKDTISLALYYDKANVVSFECNPDTIELCHNNLDKLNKPVRDRIHFFPYGAGSRKELKKFHKFVYENNPGASSFYTRIYDQYKQKTTENYLELVRVEDIINELELGNVDLVCADIQGYEIEALKGFGKYLTKIRYIITEIPKDTSLYSGAPSREQMLGFFRNNGFEVVKTLYENLHEENILFKNVARG